jgi:hypothetical protein
MRTDGIDATIGANDAGNVVTSDGNAPSRVTARAKRLGTPPDITAATIADTGRDVWVGAIASTAAQTTAITAVVTMGRRV